MKRVRGAASLLAATLAAVSLAVLVAGTASGRATAPPAVAAAGRLAELERRTAILENGPFQVIGRDHKPIFEVRSDLTVNEAVVWGASGYPAATMGATQNGGFFLLQGDDQASARMGSEGAWAGLRFEHVDLVPLDSSGRKAKSMDVTDLELGRMPTGNYVLKFVTQGGDIIAGIGESRAGSGVLIIGDAQGKKLASMFVGEANKGMIGIFGAGSGSPIAVMGEAVGNTGGSLVLGTQAGEPRVKIGTADNRYGMVETLPPSTVYVPRSGISGSYILGCAAGPSCVH